MPSARTSPRINFYFQDTYFRLERRKDLKAFLAKLFRKEGYQLFSLNIIFCTDPILLKINQEFLQHDDYTDIITFDLSETEAIEGEIYISADRVKENANSLGLPFKRELLRVIFHGALHLCGYKDKKPADKSNMRGKEDFYLETFQRST